MSGIHLGVAGQPRAKNLSPGPDGIPFAAYRKFIPLATTVLHSAAEALSQDGSKEVLKSEYEEINHSLAFFLPKMATITLESGTQVCASTVRPSK